MLTVLTPPPERIARIQADETAWYWSAAIAGVLRKHGIVSIRTPAAEAAFPVVTRGHDAALLAAGGAAACFEAPLAPTVAAALGLRAETRTAERLDLLDEERRPLGRLQPAEITVRRIPAARGERSEPRPFVADDARWNARRIRLQACTAGDGWRALAHARLDEGDEIVPAALTDGRRLVLAVPLLDLLVAGHAFVPLSDGYYAHRRSPNAFAAEAWLAERIASHAARAGTPIARVRRWPEPWTSALTVRHDHDRPVAAAALADLLDFYDELGIRASWGFLVGRPDEAAVRAVAGRGHEIVLHSEARDGRSFAAELARLEEQTGVRAAGSTCHGGLGAAGYLGQVQHEWALAEGLAYGELLGRANRLPHAAVLAGPGDAAPRTTTLAIAPVHASLDAGTAPGAHHLAHLLERVPERLAEGAHAIVMSHPDVHVPELKDLLRGLDLSRTWRATVGEIVAWTVAAKLAATATCADGAWTLAFGRPLPFPATVVLTDERGAERVITAPAGAETIRA